MPWIVGIDEAGYGPNLGPLVMSSVACQVPGDLVSADLWHILRAAVRRAGHPFDSRLLVADSKLVYAPGRGLDQLETTTLTVALLRDFQEKRNSMGDRHDSYGNTSCSPLLPGMDFSVWTLGGFLKRFAVDSCAELEKEVWYSGLSTLPQAVQLSDVRLQAYHLGRACAARALSLGPVDIVVICPTRFNQLLDRWASKGAVLAEGLAELLRRNRSALAGNDAIYVFVDKHGGRNRYAAMLQHALPAAMLFVHEESALQSVYSFHGLEKHFRITIQPRADAQHFCVALASMFSKYVRECLMLEFNRFWQQQFPDLRPTAGYPVDAARFFMAIRPALARWKISEQSIWRRK